MSFAVDLCRKFCTLSQFYDTLLATRCKSLKLSRRLINVVNIMYVGAIWTRRGRALIEIHLS